MVTFHWYKVQLSTEGKISTTRACFLRYHNSLRSHLGQAVQYWLTIQQFWWHRSALSFSKDLVIDPDISKHWKQINILKGMATAVMHDIPCEWARTAHWSFQERNEAAPCKYQALWAIKSNKLHKQSPLSKKEQVNWFSLTCISANKGLLQRDGTMRKLVQAWIHFQEVNLPRTATRRTLIWQWWLTLPQIPNVLIQLGAITCWRRTKT